MNKKISIEPIVIGSADEFIRKLQDIVELSNNENEGLCRLPSKIYRNLVENKKIIITEELDNRIKGQMSGVEFEGIINDEGVKLFPLSGEPKKKPFFDFDGNSELGLRSIYERYEIEAISIERDYTDRFFKIDYGHHYINYHSPPKTYSARVHLWNKKGYLGFIIIRHLDVFPIGATYLEPPDESTEPYHWHYPCLVRQNINIIGQQHVRFCTVFTFQDKLLTDCGVACMFVLGQVMGKKFNQKIFAKSEILKMAAPADVSWARPNPNIGITPNIALKSLKAMGYESYYERLPNIMSEYEINKAKRLMYSYNESGFPIVLVLHNLKNPNQRHAILLLGHKIHSKSFEKGPRNIGDFVENYAIYDGRLSPYMKAKLDKKVAQGFRPKKPTGDKPTAAEKEEQIKQRRWNFIIQPIFGGCYDRGMKEEWLIKRIIVPIMPRDMTLTYQFFDANVYTIIGKIIKVATSGKFDYPNYPEIKNIFSRTFMAPSNRFKIHLSNSQDFHDGFKSALKCHMSKYVWITELFTEKEYNAGRVLGTIVLNATGSGSIGDEFVFAQYKNIFVTTYSELDKGNIYSDERYIKKEDESYKRFRNDWDRRQVE